jgi:dolichyl-phosphate-mannose--protein O-mannosyl transferase
VDKEHKHTTLKILTYTIMQFTRLYFVVFLSFLFQFTFANGETESDESLLSELQSELQEVINWECSPDNPSLGKFINLKCSLLSTGD